MLGKTHDLGGILGAFVGISLLQRNNLLMQDVNPILQCVVMYPFCLAGARAPDYDQNEDAIPDKAPLGVLVNKVLRTFNGRYEKETEDGGFASLPIQILATRHRSWQTHSEILLALVGIPLYLLVGGHLLGFTNQVDVAILRLILTGLCMGILTHFILDLMTMDGLPSVILTAIKYLFWILGRKKIKYIKFVKLRVVPHNEKFGAGSKWEDGVCYFLKYMSYFYLFFYIVESTLTWSRIYEVTTSATAIVRGYLH